jgi:membrane peptidoglycan carboxypeptidase
MQPLAAAFKVFHRAPGDDGGQRHHVLHIHRQLGAEAAAQHYFRKSAASLSAYEAARLVVMLPRPRYFEKLPNSDYLGTRALVIVGRMGDARLPGKTP